MAEEFGDMKKKILYWFAKGKVGISSKAMACVAAGIPLDDHCGYSNHPHDPADFNRCLLLLDAVPEIREYFDKMAEISESWAKLIARWDELETCFHDEAGKNWCKAQRAPRTYELMKQIVGC